ncbi:MAG TPA: RluA family pseudouridine synthase [Bryobacteraceae bacterium]|nr:RluA family pseudouridine synthase [Bryobacteraceae bacterium]
MPIHKFRVEPAEKGKRLDHFLQDKLPQFSRSRVQDWIKSGRVLVNQGAEKASYALHAGDTISAEPADLPPLRAIAEDIALDILYEDSDVVAVNKPAGMVVHAGAGQHTGTLTNALVHRFGQLSGVGGEERPGIVHRLDRYTSGVLLVARNDAAHRALAAQFSSRSVEKVYLALVHGTFATDSGHIDTPIIRDPVRRVRMTTKLGRGRNAITDYKVLRRFADSTLLEVKIGTGRTHQIRVHLASVGHPVVGDTLYGAPKSEMGRYFLHAQRITFTSPSTGERVTVFSPLAPELDSIIT